MSGHNSAEARTREEKPQPLRRERNSRSWHHVNSHEMLAGRRELVIMHSGELYRLRVTSKGKLILTK